jgi:hypothetical protein
LWIGNAGTTAGVDGRRENDRCDVVGPTGCALRAGDVMGSAGTTESGAVMFGCDPRKLRLRFPKSRTPVPAD